jgi:inosine-uridine nucleoside N-ribohydrolase
VTREQYLKNLQVPSSKVDVVLDTDAYNEIDDQFAIAYLLRSGDKLNTKAIYAAPFHNDNSNGAADGMERSYREILKLLELMGETRDVFRGADAFLADEKSPVISAAAEDLARRAEKYSPEKPLYVVAIGAITNVASAILLNPKVAENTVVVWLGGHARHYHDTEEFNMRGDIAAARVVMSSGVPFVQLPCQGVVSAFTLSGPELEYWLVGKNPLADYLARNTIAVAESYAKGRPWTRAIWDVTAVAWLLNENERFMRTRILPMVLPGYDSLYHDMQDTVPMVYAYSICRDALMEDLVRKLL